MYTTANGRESQFSDDSLLELDHLADNMTNAPERERWMEDQRVGEARVLPATLRAAAAEHEQRAKALAVLAEGVEEHLTAAARGHLLSEVPQPSKADMVDDRSASIHAGRR